MLFNYKTIPGEVSTFMDIDDGQGGLPAEQSAIPADNTPVPAIADSGAEPFFVYDRDPDPKNHQSFKTKEEMADAFHHGTLRQRAFTQKTQALAEERKKHDADVARYDAEYTTFLPMKQQTDGMSKWLNSLPPNERAKLEGELKNNRAVSDPAYREMNEKIKALEEGKKTEDEQRKKDEAIRVRQESEQRANTFLSKRYPDYNAKAIDDMITALNEVPEEEQLTSLREMLYYSGKGRGTKPGVPSHQRGNVFGVITPPGKYKTMEEAAQAAKRDLGL